MLRHNELLISGSQDNTAIVRNILTAVPICVIAGHSAVVKCLALRGAFLYTGSSDKLVMCWDLRKAFEGARSPEAMAQLTKPADVAADSPAGPGSRRRTGTGSSSPAVNGGYSNMFQDGCTLLRGVWGFLAWRKF